MNSTPSGERVHIAFFGLCNTGKSSLVNAFTSQELSIVSACKGTTTDPVQKSMELLPLGPVLIIDTPGLDDTGALGALRVERTLKILRKTDIAILVSEAGRPLHPVEEELIRLFEERKLPWLLVLNKGDLAEDSRAGAVVTSALRRTGIEELKERTGALLGKERQKPLMSDLCGEGDVILLVIPIDKAAPKGRLILPQQMVIRDALDSGAIPVMARDTELEAALGKVTPKLVITDSQAFGKVSRIVPETIPLTSFSILMSRYKGDLRRQIDAVTAVDTLKDGDRVLIAEGCTHHRQCDDIGSVKIPRWIKEHTGSEPEYTFSSGTGYPEDLSGFKLIIHCGGCMLNEKEMRHRIEKAAEAGVPIANYGTLIAYLNGILRRSVAPLPGYSL